MDDNRSNKFLELGIKHAFKPEFIVDFYKTPKVNFSALDVYPLAGMSLPDIYNKVKRNGLSEKSLIIASLQAIRVLMGIKEGEKIYFISENTPLKHINQRTSYPDQLIIPNITLLELSPDEIKITKLIIAGFSTKDISKIINKSVKAISHYKISAMRKLHVHSLAELYFKLNLIE